MITLSIADALITNTTLMAKNERIQGASIFPFFTRSGQVKQLMIVLPNAKTVFMIPHKKGLATVSFFGRVRLSIDSAELKSHANFTPLQVDQLYHYDPKWLLNHERFAAYWAKPLIVRSNCFEYLGGKVSQVLYSRDLSLLERFVMKPGYLNSSKTTGPEMVLGPIPLPQPRTPGLFSTPAAGAWQMDPIWNAWSE